MNTSYIFFSCLLLLAGYQKSIAQVESVSDQQKQAVALLRCFAEFTACPERKEFMIKQADYVECITKQLSGSNAGVDCDQFRPKTDNAPTCPEDAARPREANTSINACLTSKGFPASYYADTTAGIIRELANGSSRTALNAVNQAPDLGVIDTTTSIQKPLHLSADATNAIDPMAETQNQRVTMSIEPISHSGNLTQTPAKSAVPVANNTNSDAFGLQLKKVVLGQLFDELPKKGMPNVDNPTENSRVYAFFVAKKNVTTYVTDLLAVQKYSDGTWPFTKDIKQRFASTVGISLPNTALAGFFADSLEAQKAWKEYNDKVNAYGINRFPVDFQIDPDLNGTPVSLTGPISTTRPVSSAKVTKVINLPDVTVAGKYRPSLGIMPIVDAKNTLNEQFLVYQYLKDNPVIINNSDTLQASLTDYRAYTQFSIGGIMSNNSYSLKLWQKEKLLAEIIIGFTESTTLEQRMTGIGRQLGQILSGNTNNYQVQASTRTRNLLDNIGVIKNEVHKATEISTLLPNATTLYLPSNFSLPSELSHLLGRVSNMPYLNNPSANGMAQAVRGIYQDADEKQFFFTNGNIPSDMKAAVRKITEPTSRRIGSALSYVAVGDAFLNTDHNIDGAACSYYSALLLAPNLAASPFEKAAVKRMVYQRMKHVAETRQQPYLAGLFDLAANLNDSFINSDLARSSHQEYYNGISNTANICLTVENQAREIRAQQRKATFGALMTIAGGVAQAANGQSFSDAQLQQMANQIQSYSIPTEQMQSVFAETLQDLKYENFEVRDESGDNVELNKLYLNLEILWHLGLRKDQVVVGKQLLAYAADKTNLRIALEEYLAEPDANQQAKAISTFQACFQQVEEQANRYESWGKKLPKKVVARF